MKASKRIVYFRAALKQSSGETLVETLLSTLIVSAVILMLCTAVVAASKINAKASETDSSFHVVKSEPGLAVADLYIDNAKVAATDLNWYKTADDNGYVYFELHF